ncbi:S41 family peptidase [Porphyromonas levii]|uniref:S41 family peptidase n=1 Tax=Porphyromonas levii TaxID=28114 RepID=A0A4Y8WN73_9PORP|nr:S41 family peptidase [Porphyromonas levii]TFH94590.1 S41 family peptidase [Porphyromonas levii]TFH95741.1 S41 family peptidase [Porphyromonas levii]
MRVRSILIGMVLALPMMAVAQTPNNKTQQKVGRAQEVFASVLAGASGYYVDTIDVQKVSTRGINAMLSQLDPYTEYIQEKDAEDFQMLTTGEYAGIGAYIQLVDSTVYVQYPMPGSPAEKAGLGMGDAFLEIDGVSVVPGTPAMVSGKLKGPVGTTVKVKVKRLGKSAPEEFTIVRGNVVVDQVVYRGMYADGVGYIRLSSFTTRSADDVKRAYEELNKGGKMKSLILDLRSNGGGVMDGAIDILSMFVPKGTKVLYTKGRLPQTSQEYFTEQEPIALDIPLVVMINGGSASASEIVAGALQDLDRAVLVGSKSFGKGLVQSTLPVPYDGILKVTVSRYHIPSGRCIQQLDYSHRNPDGSVAAVPDSLTQVFKTVGGREVRDGGGIRPDIEIEGETLDAIVFAMSNQGRLFEFVNQLYLERPKTTKLSDVVITDEDIDRFITYLEQNGFEYGEMSKEALGAVERMAEFEGYKEQAKEAFAKLKEVLTPSLRRDMEPSREQVKRMMRGLLAQHYFGQEGQYAVTLESDPTMKGALEVLTDTTKYHNILKGNKQ